MTVTAQMGSFEKVRLQRLTGGIVVERAAKDETRARIPYPTPNARALSLGTWLSFGKTPPTAKATAAEAIPVRHQANSVRSSANCVRRDGSVLDPPLGPASAMRQGNFRSQSMYPNA